MIDILWKNPKIGPYRKIALPDKSFVTFIVLVVIFNALFTF